MKPVIKSSVDRLGPLPLYVDYQVVEDDDGELRIEVLNVRMGFTQDNVTAILKPLLEDPTRVFSILALEEFTLERQITDFERATQLSSLGTQWDGPSIH